MPANSVLMSPTSKPYPSPLPLGTPLDLRDTSLPGYNVVGLAVAPTMGAIRIGKTDECATTSNCVTTNAVLTVQRAATFGDTTYTIPSLFPCSRFFSDSRVITNVTGGVNKAATFCSGDTLKPRRLRRPFVWDHVRIHATAGRRLLHVQFDQHRSGKQLHHRCAADGQANDHIQPRCDNRRGVGIQDRAGWGPDRCGRLWNRASSVSGWNPHAGWREGHHGSFGPDVLGDDLCSARNCLPTEPGVLVWPGLREEDRRVQQR